MAGWTMAKARPEAPARENRLLALLPPGERRRLGPLLRPVTLDFGQVIYEQLEPIEFAYFPTGAVFSALRVMAGGDAIEVATVGSEGLVGYSAASGRARSPNQVIAQIGGEALRIEAQALRDRASRKGPFRELLGAYEEAYMAQVSQSVACNGLHGLGQRCCRWLLMSRDRVGSDELRLTHEYLGMMLGARRASVTEVLRPLQEAGLVRSWRGVLSILDRAGLEARACECYRVVRDEYARLLGVPPG